MGFGEIVRLSKQKRAVGKGVLWEYRAYCERKTVYGALQLRLQRRETVISAC